MVKKIEYKLFDGLNLKNNSSNDDTTKTVAFNTSDGGLIN